MLPGPGSGASPDWQVAVRARFPGRSGLGSGQVRVVARTVSVAVRAERRMGACGRGHIADSVAAANRVRWCLRSSEAVRRCRQERSVKPSAQPTLVRTQHLPPPAKTARSLRKRGPAPILRGARFGGWWRWLPAQFPGRSADPAASRSADFRFLSLIGPGVPGQRSASASSATRASSGHRAAIWACSPVSIV
jgi:hypothetical protein